MTFNYPLLEMANYNQWQNQNLIRAADQLSDKDRQADLGAFFQSIEKTFNHILWADKMWLMRFSDFPAPKAKNMAEALTEGGKWSEFKVQRATLDETIISWAKNIEANPLPEKVTWFSNAINREVSRPTNILVPHFFNHQTHHRGQIHAMLTRLGQKPSDTDLPFMPEFDIAT